MDINGRWMHVAVFFVCLVGAGMLIFFFSDLTKDQPTTLGTIGVFLTLYGVFFAIVEVARLRSASELAKREANRVFDSVTNLVTRP